MKGPFLFPFSIWQIMGARKTHTSHSSSQYSQSGVDYSKLDHLKLLAQESAAQTSKNIVGTAYIEHFSSRGESAYLLEHASHYIAFVQEGLGTKSLVADEVRKYTGKTHYDAIAQDTVAMIINDLISVGARPLSVFQYLSTGDPVWLTDEERLVDLVTGWKNACNAVGATWGGGETPGLKGVVEPNAVDLAGSAIGIVEPKSRVLLSEKIQDGDVMIGFESSGVHANGVSLLRKIADQLPKKYQTLLPSGTSFGEVILQPTLLYSAVLQEIFAANVELHYAVNVTGHGWRKLMRPKRNFHYDVEFAPEVPEIFPFIQQHAKMSDEEMYATYNMGVGFVVYAAAKDTEKILKISQQQKIQAWKLGSIKTAKHAMVTIKPKEITYHSEDLQIRM